MSRPSRPSVVAEVVGGIAGTAAYTVVSTALKHIGVSTHAVQSGAVAAALTGSERAHRKWVNTVLHWGYGVCGALARTGLVATGLSGWRLILSHLLAVWLPWRALLIIAGQGKSFELGALLVDVGKHLVYVLGAGATSRLLGRRAEGVRTNNGD